MLKINQTNKFQFINKITLFSIIIHTFICRFIVIQNNVMKYITNIGQNTGTLKKSKNVHISPIIVLFEIDNQNLNSGKRRINGRNSSLLRVGKLGPSSEKKKKKN